MFGGQVSKRKRAKSTGGLMAMKLVQRGKTGKIIDRASSTKGKQQKAMPSALARLFATAHDPFACGEGKDCAWCAVFWTNEQTNRKIREKKGE